MKPAEYLLYFFISNLKFYFFLKFEATTILTQGALTHYAYDENARLIGEYNAAGQAIQETVYLFGQPIAVLKGTAIYNVHADHLGSPRKITNQAGSTVWQWQDKPFGDAPINQDPDGNGVAFEYNLRFPGQYFDKETGLHYNYYRYYDPQTGRYITSDPIGLAGGLNTYGYVGGNPVSYTDSSGLFVDEAAVQAALEGVATVAGVATSAVSAVAAGVAAAVYPSPVGEGSDIVPTLDCPPNDDDNNDDECEKRLKREEFLCEAIAGPRYFGDAKKAVAICKKAAFNRYSKCLMGIPESMWPPLTGVDTPI